MLLLTLLRCRPLLWADSTDATDCTLLAEDDLDNPDDGGRDAGLPALATWTVYVPPSHSLWKRPPNRLLNRLKCACDAV